MRSIWNGSISFALVNIPIALYPVAESKVIGFHLLCNTCENRIKYKRWCAKCKKEVDWDNIVKGLEVTKGKYVVLKKETIEKLKPSKTDQIEILEFISIGQIDPIQLNKKYYIVPATAKDRAYFLFKQVLQETAKVAIGKFVMREKEYLCAIESYKNGLLLTTLSYSYEIRDIKKIARLKGAPKLKKEELALARKIVKQYSKEVFDLKKYKDTYAKKLKKLIEGKSPITIEEPKKKQKNLMEALKASTTSKK